MEFYDPVACLIGPQTGTLGNRTGRYEKRLADLGGLYRDTAAFAGAVAHEGDRVVYTVEEFRPTEASGDLIFGMTHMEPGMIGDEFFMTRGHIHRAGNRPEIYQGISGEGLMLLESPDGEIRIVEVAPLSVCYVPPFWIHRSVNTGAAPLVMFFCYPSDSGQDYEIIARAGGMRSRIHASANGGWEQRENDLYNPRSPEAVAAVMATAI